jgi:hypothetical protein
MNEMRTSPADPRPDAVVWIDEARAIVARLEPEGRIATVEIRRLQQPEARYLSHVVHEIGNHEHVLVVGPHPIRVALERRYVGVSHRPDRLMPVPPAARAAGAEMLERLDHLAA